MTTLNQKNLQLLDAIDTLNSKKSSLYYNKNYGIKKAKQNFKEGIITAAKMQSHIEYCKNITIQLEAEVANLEVEVAKLEAEVANLIETANIEEIREVFQNEYFEIPALIGVATFDNFFKKTYGVWNEVKTIPATAVCIYRSDYNIAECKNAKDAKNSIRFEGAGFDSQYYKKGEFLYRISDHWGRKIRSCDWILNGRNKWCAMGKEIKIGKIWIGDLFEKEDPVLTEFKKKARKSA
jgi:hypothetical protein